MGKEMMALPVVCHASHGTRRNVLELVHVLRGLSDAHIRDAKPEPL